MLIVGLVLQCPISLIFGSSSVDDSSKAESTLSITTS